MDETLDHFHSNRLARKILTCVHHGRWVPAKMGSQREAYDDQPHVDAGSVVSIYLFTFNFVAFVAEEQRLARRTTNAMIM